MMLPSHLLGTLLVGLLVSRLAPFRPRDWALAVGFGVVIDLDHLLQIPAYVAANGLGALQPGEMLAWGGAWQGIMHDPTSAIWIVGGAMLIFRSVLPLLFWGLHMFQDFFIATRVVPFGSGLEWLVVAGLALAVVGLLWLDHRAAVAARDARDAPAPVAFHHHALARIGLAALIAPRGK